MLVALRIMIYKPKLLLGTVYSVKQFCATTTGSRSLDVAVIGAPNVGKSLLTNQLVRAAVSAVSSKMDTTIKNVEAVLTEDNVQLIVLDSPGTVGVGHAKNVMGKGKEDRILTDPENALKKAQHVLVVQDATATGDYIHHRVLHLLHRNSQLASSLVLNKIDLVNRRSDLLELARILTNGQVAGVPIKSVQNTIGRLGTANNNLKLHDESLASADDKWVEHYRRIITKPINQCGYAETKQVFMNIRGWSHFGAVFFVSSLTGEGIEPLRQHLKALSEHRQWRMNEMTVTSKSPQQICIESIRAAVLDTVPSNIAYRLRPQIIEWREDGEVLQIVGEISCNKEREGRLVVGKGGRRIAEIGRRVNDHMHTLFQRQLFVRILVKHNNKVVDVIKT